MSGTSLDAVDAALIRTDGTHVLEFGAVAERKYTPAERRVLQVATDAARAWNWAGPRITSYNVCYTKLLRRLRELASQ